MESNRNLSKESSELRSSSTSAGGAKIGQQSAASAVQSARDTAQTTLNQTKQAVNDAYEKTSEVLGNAYEKTSEVVGQTYNQAITYGKENPGKVTLIAFGAGIGVGILLSATMGGGRSRTSRIAEPIIGALSQIAVEFMR